MAHDDPHPAGERRFQVWHRSGDGYTPVALVNIGNLLGALVLTINRKDGLWETGERVTALQTGARSTDAGDVIVSPENAAYEIRTTALGLTFAPIDFPPQREQVALFAEWTQDYAAAAHRDGRAAFRALLGGADAPSPQPVIAQERDRDVER